MEEKGLGNATLFTKDDCPRCVAVKAQIEKREKLIEQAGHTVSIRNMDEDATALDEALAAGVKAAPALKVGDVWLQSMSEILRHLKQYDAAA